MRSTHLIVHILKLSHYMLLYMHKDILVFISRNVFMLPYLILMVRDDLPNTKCTVHISLVVAPVLIVYRHFYRFCDTDESHRR